MTKVINSAGKEIDLDATLSLMDNELRETIAAEGLESDQEFFGEYCKAHLAKFGEEFEPDKWNGQW